MNKSQEAQLRQRIKVLSKLFWAESDICRSVEFRDCDECDYFVVLKSETDLLFRAGIPCSCPDNIHKSLCFPCWESRHQTHNSFNEDEEVSYNSGDELEGEINLEKAIPVYKEAYKRSLVVSKKNIAKILSLKPYQWKKQIE